MLKRIISGHQQAFFLSMVVTLCYLPMTLGLLALKYSNVESPIVSLVSVSVILAIGLMVCPLLVLPCARAFGITFCNDSSDSPPPTGSSGSEPR